MYANFAGRDASRGMAKQSFDVGSYSILLLIFCLQPPDIYPILITEMLTPIDQPLDKLEDLAKDEMCVYPSPLFLKSTDTYFPMLVPTWTVSSGFLYD